LRRYAYWIVAAALAGCGTEDPGTLGSGGSGPGGGGGLRIDLDARGTGGSGGGGATSVSPEGQLNVVVRDFRLYKASDSKTNPDFENVPATADNEWGPWPDPDIVADRLGDDFKPVYKNASGTTLTTHGKDSFDQWFRTVDGTNIMQEIPLTLKVNAQGAYEYDSRSAGAPLSPGGMFFPIDDNTPYKTAFGQEGKSHNYSFTVEIHTLFTYQGGEHFFFSGDDDVFVYIDNKLVINLGGIHSREQADVRLDDLGLEKGKTYPLDFFYAERHVVESNLWITTTLGLSNNTDIPIF